MEKYTELPPLEVYRYGPNDHEFYYRRDVDERIASLTRRLQEQEAAHVIALGKFRKELGKAGLHGHYNLFQQTFNDELAQYDEYQRKFTALQESQDAMLETCRWVLELLDPEDYPASRGAIEVAIDNAEKLRGPQPTESEQK